MISVICLNDFLIFQVKVDEDDFFMDALEENDAEGLGSADSGEFRFKKCFSSLDDMANNEEIKTPINVPVDKSRGEIILMIIKYAIVHALSLTEMTDLFMLINCIFAYHITPNTRYLIDKLFYPKNGMELHATCPKCNAYISKFQRKDSFVKCKACKLKINVKDYKYKNFFVTMDASSHISKLIESNSEYYTFVVSERVHEKGVKRDIYDGKLYRQFFKSSSQVSKQNYATLILNTDGAPLFNSSTYSIWPIFVMVNELPVHVRTKELILVALWFGKDKPNMNVFLGPFVDQMNTLATKGVQCKINNKEVNVKVFTKVCCVDSVARAPVQGFSQFNGSYGCNQCLHPGEWVQNKKKPNNRGSENIEYPLQNKVPKNRNMEDTIEHMRLASNLNKPVFGVKNLSQLINLISFTFLSGCVSDSMHLLSGVAKQFATMLFGNKKKGGLFSKSMIPKIDNALINIKAPHQIVRLTRSFTEKEFWKAREWENWTLFFNLPILSNVLPNNFVMHWALFIEAMYLPM